MEKRDKKNMKKVISVVLLVGVLFSSYFLAKYISSLDGADNTSVAKWSVEAVPNTDTLNLVSGNIVGVYTLTITSMSEVSARYSVMLSNVPDELEVKIDNGEYQTADNSGSIVFENVGTINVGNNSSARVHSLTFNSPLDSSIPSTNAVDVNVEFVQVD